MRFKNYCQYFTTNLLVIFNLHTVSMYILSVNVIYGLLTDNVHTTYMAMEKENFSCNVQFQDPHAANDIIT